MFVRIVISLSFSRLRLPLMTILLVSSTPNYYNEPGYAILLKLIPSCVSAKK